MTRSGGPLCASALLDGRLWFPLPLNSLPLHPTVCQYLVAQDELCLASHWHRVDRFDPLDFDFSMHAAQYVLGSVCHWPLYRQKSLLYLFGDHHHAPLYRLVRPPRAGPMETAPVENPKMRTHCVIFIRGLVRFMHDDVGADGMLTALASAYVSRASYGWSRS